MKKLILLSFCLSACTVNMAKLSVVSTNNYELDNEYVSIGTITGEDRKYIIIFIPTGTPRIDNAIDDALSRNKAEFITDASIDYNTFYIPYIGGYNQYIINGEGWQAVNNSSKILKTRKNILIKFDPETGKQIPPNELE